LEIFKNPEKRKKKKKKNQAEAMPDRQDFDRKERKYRRELFLSTVLGEKIDNK